MFNSNQHNNAAKKLFDNYLKNFKKLDEQQFEEDHFTLLCKVDNYVKIVEANSSMLQRLIGVGAIPEEDLRSPAFLNEMFELVGMKYRVPSGEGTENHSPTQTILKGREIITPEIVQEQIVEEFHEDIDEDVEENIESDTIDLTPEQFFKLITVGKVVTLEGVVKKTNSSEEGLHLNFHNKIRPPVNILENAADVIDFISISNICIETASGNYLDFEEMKKFAKVFCN